MHPLCDAAKSTTCSGKCILHFPRGETPRPPDTYVMFTSDPEHIFHPKQSPDNFSNRIKQKTISSRAWGQTAESRSVTEPVSPRLGSWFGGGKANILLGKQCCLLSLVSLSCFRCEHRSPRRKGKHANNEKVADVARQTRPIAAWIKPNVYKVYTNREM